MPLPPSNLIQFPARAEPPEAPNLAPPPPAPTGFGSWEPFWNDHLYHLGVADWLIEELQYLYPSYVPDFPPVTIPVPPAPTGFGAYEPYWNPHLPHLGVACWLIEEIQYLYQGVRPTDMDPENITVDKYSSFNSSQNPPVYLEIEAANQEPNQEVHDPVYPVVALQMWHAAFGHTLWEIEEAVQTVGWFDLNPGDLPADPAALLRPWHVPFDDPMPPMEDTACWQEYAKLDLDQSQRLEFIYIGDYWIGWDNPIGHYVEIEPAPQESAIAVLGPFYVGLVETIFVTDFNNPWEPFLWVADEPTSGAATDLPSGAVLAETIFVTDFSNAWEPFLLPSDEPTMGTATEFPWAVFAPQAASIVLFVTPMFAGGFRFSRL